MTREEEIIKAARKYVDGCTLSSPSDVLYFEAGARWADNNPPEGVVNLEEIWHLSTEIPDPTKSKAVCYCINDKYIFCVGSCCSKEVFLTTWKDILDFKDTASRMRWAYLDDLIKGIYNDK